MHLRAPSISPGVTAFLWALMFTVYLWAFMLAVGVSNGVAVLVAVVAGFGIFLAVRIYGVAAPRRRRAKLRGGSA
jgi:hypothetical protein